LPTIWECLPVVERMYKEGRPVREIARVCRSFSMVYRALRVLVREGRVKPRGRLGVKKRRLSEEEKRTILELYRRGWTVYAIAANLGRPVSTVSTFLRSVGASRGSGGGGEGGGS
jgi:transposase